MVRVPRVIAVMVGSESDLSQCVEGFKALEKAREEGKIDLFDDEVRVSSIHRATEATLERLRKYHSSACGPQVLITGAGWANHLSGTCDAYLRNELGDQDIFVIGVAFEDPKNEEHTETAIRSIAHVPGNQVVMGDDEGPYVGGGFLRACQRAIDGPLSGPIELPKARPAKGFSLTQAIAIGLSQRAEAAAKTAAS